MRVAVLSDTHDHLQRIDAALPHLRKTEAVLHCGDLCAPFVLKRLGDGLPSIPLHVVFGNNDGDPFLLQQVASSYAHISLHAPLAELELGGRRIAVNHYPSIARGLAHSGLYDLVCYGHDHLAHEERVGDCLLLNPGEVMGMNGRSSLAIVELSTMAVAWIELD